jgi:hypothetical protein
MFSRGVKERASLHRITQMGIEEISNSPDAGTMIECELCKQPAGPEIKWTNDPYFRSATSHLPAENIPERQVSSYKFEADHVLSG